MGGPGYWYSERRLEIDTTPPGATVDLFYVRRNFQKGFEQADAPVTVVLPSRIEAGPRDSVTIRAYLDGYRQQEVSVKVRSRQTQVMIDLEPLSNSLVAFRHVYFADRASLNFLTDEALVFRLQKADDGFSVVLTETGNTTEAASSIGGAKSSLVASMRPQQLGEDLVVRVALTDRASDDHLDVRSRQAFDPVRRLHVFSLDLVPEDGGAAAVRRAKAALARVGASDVSGCAARFDEVLREELEPSGLARALTPSGSFTDPYLRAAMKRLGEVSPDGFIVLADGTRYRAAIPLELTAASSQAADAKGYLALLRSFVGELEGPEHRRETLRGLVAPEVAPQTFAATLERAESEERRCLS
jgi:hypothetical protein